MSAEARHKDLPYGVVRIRSGLGRHGDRVDIPEVNLDYHQYTVFQGLVDETMYFGRKVNALICNNKARTEGIPDYLKSLIDQDVDRADWLLAIVTRPFNTPKPVIAELLRILSGSSEYERIISARGAFTLNEVERWIIFDLAKDLADKDELQGLSAPRAIATMASKASSLSHCLPRRKAGNLSF